MNIFLKCCVVSVASIGVALSLTACGGGGGDGGGGGGNPNVGGEPQSVSGTVAKGAALVGSKVSMTCANGVVLEAVSSTVGGYTTAPVSIAFPCIGTAVGAGNSPSYRGVIFSGGVANFTPLTDMLVQSVLAASAAGDASLSLAEFISKMSADAVFSANVRSSSNVSAYRATVLNIIAKELSATKSPAEIAIILAAASNFESTPFVIGSLLDKVLENTAFILQNLDGSIRAAILALIKALADLLPLPPGGNPTGATGATGGTGGSGGSGG